VITLIVLLVGVVLGMVATAFLLGFRLGGEHWQAEAARVRVEAHQAERRLHDLTRQAFVRHGEHVQHRRNQ